VKNQRVYIFLLLIALSCSGLLYTGFWTPVAETQSPHVMVAQDQVKWGPAPPSLPPGAQLAVLDGDPSKTGAPFTMRVKFPKGYKVPPHWHPIDENVVVLKGVLMMGVGDKFNESAAHEMREGTFAKMPKETRHYAWTKEETVIQVHGIGPYEVTYVNPSDEPRTKSSNK
jgi:quercetin dioxygenase-like cupin family protein